MRKLRTRALALITIGALALSGCAQTAIAPATGVTPSTVCQAVATIQGNQAAASQLAAIPPTSALGVVWAQFQSGCAAGQPAVGVSTSWSAMLGGMFKTLLPQVLPTVAADVLPLLIGLI